MKWRKGVMLTVCTLVLVAAGYGVYSQYQKDNVTTHADVGNAAQGNETAEGVNELAELRMQIEEYFAESDPTTARKRFNDTNDRVRDVGDQHVRDHVFGEVLYEHMGSSGIKICDGAYDYGCIHSVVTTALAEKGVASVRELNEQCLNSFSQRPRSCQHGLGHGIVAHLGGENVFDALALCEQLAEDGPIHGCQDGVFMEYNTQFILNGLSESSREITEEGLHYPCDQVADTHRNWCYFRQSHWWVDVVEHERLAELGNMCSEIKDVSGRQWCYRGLGFIEYYRTNFSVSDTMAACDTFSSAEGRAHCYQSLRLTHEYQNPDAGDAFVCSDLPQDQKDICIATPPEGF